MLSLLALAALAQSTVPPPELTPAQSAPQAAPEEPADTTGETLVTARKRSEAIEDIPGAVSVITAEDIEAGGMRSVSDAARGVPNVSLTEFSSRRLSFPFVRGVGAGQGEAAVVTYVDGVPQLTTGSTNLPLIGLERVEFLRGPQGPLYGRNALGGVIKLESRPPGPEPHADFSATLGEFDTQEFSAAYSGPIGFDDGPYVDLTLLNAERDGYTENTFTGNDVDYRDAFFGRAQVLTTPGENSEVRIGLYGEHARDGGFVLSDLAGLRQDPHQINQNFEGVAERDVLAPFVNWQRFGERIDFTSITAYTDWDVLETSDFDFSPLDIVRRTTTEEQAYVYQELRFASSEARASDGRLRWLAGVQAFAADSDRSAANDFRVPLPVVGVDTTSGDFEDLGAGVFGEATLVVRDDLELTAGLRYDYESKEADLQSTFVDSTGTVLSNVQSSFDEDFDQLLPSASAAWHAGEDATVYGTVAKGYRAGGFNLRAPAGQEEFDPEESWSYEVGLKTEWWQERLDVRLAAFYVDWQDMQLNLFDPVAGGYVDNAGESTSQGAELEAAADVHEHVELFGGVGLVETEFDEYTDTFGNDVSGQELPFVPESTWSLGAELDGPLGAELRWFTRAEYAVVGDFFYDPNNTEGESYDLVNLRAGLERKGWSFTVWARNLFDEEYFPVAFQPNPGNPAQFVAESGEPQVFGATLRASF